MAELYYIERRTGNGVRDPDLAAKVVGVAQAFAHYAGSQGYVSDWGGADEVRCRRDNELAIRLKDIDISDIRYPDNPLVFRIILIGTKLSGQASSLADKLMEGLSMYPF